MNQRQSPLAEELADKQFKVKAILSEYLEKCIGLGLDATDAKHINDLASAASDVAFRYGHTVGVDRATALLEACKEASNN